jgi:putative methionine-R-sulfoxide reductase with GAF domain
MSGEASVKKPSIISEIRKKIRLLNFISAFVIIILLAVIFRYLFKPLSETLAFLPDISITLIILIVVTLAIASFYMWGVVSRRIIRIIQKYRERLDSVLAITRELREEIYGDILLNKIMDHSLSLTRSDAGAILLIEDGNLVYKIVKGEKAEQLTGKTIPVGQGIVGRVAQTGIPERVAHAGNDERIDIPGYETKSVLCVPLALKTGITGVMELLNKKDGSYSEKDEEIIAYLADQAAVSLMQARFHEDQKNYEIHVTDILLETMDTQISDKRGHSKRVAQYCNIIAKAINMSEKEQKRLYFACLLHDVGFLKINARHHAKREHFAEHPVVGYEMISQINFYADIAPFILHHHERYDGAGYPGGLKGEAIPLEARMIAIADAFDAMTSTATYKDPLDFDAAIEELQRNAGTQFDFWLVDMFVQNVTREHLQ